VKASPALTSSTPDVAPVTATGAGLMYVLVPFPISPESPRPQQRAAPPESSAQLWFLPVLTSTTPLVRPATATGTELEKIESPVPSWPYPWLPQHLAAPLCTAHVCRSPAAIAVTPVLSPKTATGTGLSALALLPSWP
jgi:hypothetical protein